MVIFYMYCECVIDTRQRRGVTPPQISDVSIGYLNILSCFLNMSSHTCDILNTWFFCKQLMKEVAH